MLKLFLLSLLLFSELLAEEDRGDTVQSFFLNSSDFFESNAASTVFSEPPRITEQPQLGSFDENTKKKTKLEGKKKRKESDVDKKLGTKDFRTREDIIQTFGNPSDLMGKLPIESLSEQAPPSLKGLVAALNLGDEKLAEEYAVAYADYMATLQSYFNKINRVVELQNKAKKGDLSSEDLIDLPKEILDQLKRPGVVPLELKPEEVKKLLLDKEESILNLKEAIEDNSSLLNFKLALQERANPEAIARSIVEKYGLYDKSFELLIILNHPNTSNLVKVASMLSSLVSQGFDAFISPSVICIPNCRESERKVLDTLVGMQIKVVSSFKAPKELKISQDVEYLLIGSESGKVLKLSEADSEILGNIIKYSAVGL